MNLFLTLLPLIARGAIVESPTSGLYVWGPEKNFKLKPSELAIGRRPELSFIDLFYGDGTLIIFQVQRGRGWPAGESFCSLMLPATIRDYLEKLNVDLETALREISVVNIADSEIAGCKCYLSTMRAFGFDIINGQSHNDPSYCSSSEYELVITGTSSSSPRRGENSEQQLLYLSRAKLRP